MYVHLKINYGALKYIWGYIGVEMDVQSMEKSVRFMELKGERKESSKNQMAQISAKM